MQEAARRWSQAYSFAAKGLLPLLECPLFADEPWQFGYQAQPGNLR